MSENCIDCRQSVIVKDVKEDVEKLSAEVKINSDDIYLLKQANAVHDIQMKTLTSGVDTTNKRLDNIVKQNWAIILMFMATLLGIVFKG